MLVFPGLLVLHSIAIDKYGGLAMKATVVYVMLYYSEENVFVCLHVTAIHIKIINSAKCFWSVIISYAGV